MAVVEEECPIFWDLPGADKAAAASFAKFCKAADRKSSDSRADRVRELFPEGNSYQLATLHRPSWSKGRVEPGCVNAANIYGVSFSLLSSAMNCKPELPVRCSSRRVPGFNVELKTMGDKGIFDGAATYVAFDMLRSFFTRWNEGEVEPSCENDLLFYNRPPIGYAVCGAPPVGWVVLVEWIGRLYLSAYSQPFFLGSDEHVSVIQGLDRPQFDEPLDLAADLSNRQIWDIANDLSLRSSLPLCCWTKSPASGGIFYKVKMWDAVAPELQKRTALAYAAYGAARAAAQSAGEDIPSALVEAGLYFVRVRALGRAYAIRVW